MLDDFFTRAIIAGIGIAIIAGPLGCFIVWRRMAYFGDTLAHAALLGVSLGVLLEFNFTLAVFTTSCLVSVLLVVLQRNGTLSSDAILGLLSHSGLALGLLAISLMGATNVDITSLLFGDILSVTVGDLGLIYGAGFIVLAILGLVWRTLFASTVSSDIAIAEGANTQTANLAYMIAMAAVIALSMKIVGVLLITAMLIIPAAAARRFAQGPEHMAAISVVIGVSSVVMGMFGSLEFDTPSAPSIVVAAFCIFVVSLIPLSVSAKRRGRQK